MRQESFIARVFWNGSAPIVQGLISLAMLPVTTAILGPAEIGIFALVMSISSLVAAFSGMGSSFLLSAHYPTATADERKGLVSALVVVSFMVNGVIGLVVLVFWHWLSTNWEMFAGVPIIAVAMAMAASTAATPWGIALDVLMLRRTARNFALVACLQSAVTALATVLGLYIFKLGLVSLFVANLAGAITVGLTSLIFMRSDISWRLDGRWLGTSLRTGTLMGAGPLLQSLFVIVERSTIISSAGLTALGLYAHSQQYRNIVEVGVKGVSRSIWPISLDEARTSPRIFVKTDQAWRATILVVTIGGIFFALFAKEMLNILTHGKFVAAAPYLALWMVYILLRSTGRPQIAVLNAERRVQSVAYIEQTMLVVGIITLIAFVPIAGVLGAFAALFLSQMGTRIAYHLCARNLDCPFQDGWTLVGCATVLLTVWLQSEMAFSLLVRASIFFITAFIFVIPFRRVLRDIISVVGARRV